MTIKNLGYVIKLAFQGIFRNSVMSLASLLVLISCLVVTGTTYVLSENIEYNIDQLSGYNKIVAFVKQDAEEFELKDLQNRIESIEDVAEVRLITKDEALDSYQEEYGDFEYLFEMFEAENPLKDSFEITYRDGATADEVGTIVYQIQQLEKDGIVKINNRQDIAQKLTDLKNIVSLILTWLTVLLFVISVFVVTNTVRLAVFARRDEISIMRNVGATRTFVSMPFLLEGTILGLISAVISYFGLVFLYQGITEQLTGFAESQFIEVLPFDHFRIILVVVFAAIAVFTGLISGIVALRRQKQN